MTDQLPDTNPAQSRPPADSDAGSNVLTLKELQNGSDTFEAIAPASLGQMLVEAGVLASDQVAKVQEVARRDRQTLGRVLVKGGLISPETWPLLPPCTWALPWWT